MDEPTSGLDATAATDILTALKRYTLTDTCWLLSVHCSSPGAITATITQALFCSLNEQSAVICCVMKGNVQHVRQAGKSMCIPNSDRTLLM